MPKKSNITPVVVPKIKEGKRNSAVLALITSALTAARSMVQSAQLLEPELSKAAVACVEHFSKYGDLGPADRLMKGLQALSHPITTGYSRELTLWFKKNSPIQWALDGTCFKNKDEAKGRLDTDLKAATETPFNETPEAKKARAISAASHKNALEDADAKMLVRRVLGVKKWLDNMKTGKDDRKIKDGELDKMETIIAAVDAAVVKAAGKELVKAAA